MQLVYISYNFWHLLQYEKLWTDIIKIYQVINEQKNKIFDQISSTRQYWVHFKKDSEDVLNAPGPVLTLLFPTHLTWE